MIQVNLKNGSTIHFDFENQGGYSDWSEFCQDPSIPPLITGLGILYNQQAFLIPIPKAKENRIKGIGGGISRNKDGEVSAEYVWYKVDDTIIKQTVYTGLNKVAKVEIQGIKW